VDHTLIRYQAKEIYPILCNSLYKVLIDEKGYPSSMLNFGTFERNFFMNGLVIDLKTGNVLKLGENKQVLRAYFGETCLSPSKIEEAYGNPPMFDIFDGNFPFNEYYFCCLSFFECYFPLVFAKMVEYKRQNQDSLTPEELKQILDDGFYAVGVNYSHSTEENYYPILQFGHYYKSVIENIDKVIYKQDHMLGALRYLKSQGKPLFLVSDSHYEYVGTLMDHAYGKNWLDIFDFALLHAKKPSFFNSSTRPFKEIDHNKANKMGEEVRQLERHTMYTEGNAGLLKRNLDFITGKKGKVLYFGDHYAYDILAAKDLKDWDTVCVIEEMGDLDLGDDYDGRIWGHWQYEETSDGVIPTYWYSKMMKKADKCTSLVDSKEMMDFFYERE